MGRLVDQINGYVMANSPYRPNLGSLSHPHGLEEAPVVHQPGPGHLGDVIIGSVMTNTPFMPNLGSLSHPHVLAEAPVVHQPDPGGC